MSSDRIGQEGWKGAKDRLIDKCPHMMYNVRASISIVGCPDLRGCEPFGYAGAGLGTGHIVQSGGQ